MFDAGDISFLDHDERLVSAESWPHEFPESDDVANLNGRSDADAALGEFARTDGEDGAAVSVLALGFGVSVAGCGREDDAAVRLVLGFEADEDAIVTGADCLVHLSRKQKSQRFAGFLEIMGERGRPDAIMGLQNSACQEFMAQFLARPGHDLPPFVRVFGKTCGFPDKSPGCEVAGVDGERGFIWLAIISDNSVHDANGDLVDVCVHGAVFVVVLSGCTCCAESSRDGAIRKTQGHSCCPSVPVDQNLV